MGKIGATSNSAVEVSGPPQPLDEPADGAVEVVEVAVVEVLEQRELARVELLAVDEEAVG